MSHMPTTGSPVVVETRPIAMTLGREEGDVHSIGSTITLAASTNALLFPVPLRIGSTIKGFQFWLSKNTDAPGVLRFDLFSITNGVLSSSLMTVSSAATPAGDVDVEASGSVLIESGKAYYIVCTPTGSDTPAADLLYHCEVTGTP